MNKTAILNLFKRITKYSALLNYYERQFYINVDEAAKSYYYTQFAICSKISQELFAIINDFDLEHEYNDFIKSPIHKSFYKAVLEFYNMDGGNQ